MSRAKEIVFSITPPLLLNVILAVRTHLSNKDRLFGGDDALFKHALATAGTSVYAEYGCGASTCWVHRNTDCRILSVDSSADWLDIVRDRCGNSQRLSLHHAELGPLREWGAPSGYSRHENFADYTDWIWQQGVVPDVILVDGRFRVCCFLTTLLHARAGARIVFDDYTNRPCYHIVERFLKPTETFGRQALFIMPSESALDQAQIAEFVRRFRFVTE